MSVYMVLELESGRYSEKGLTTYILPDLEQFDELEVELTRQGIRPLREFVFHDADLLEEMLECAPDETRENLRSQLNAARQQPDWHQPQEGVKSIGPLIELLDEQEISPGAVSHLKFLQRILLEAERTGDRFRIVTT